MLDDLQSLLRTLRAQMRLRFNRHVSTGDLLTDRWELAKEYGFGEGSSCYDNSLILGNVTVGRNTWIGPNCVLDGSGGLVIGDDCSIGAGVQIYSHQTLQRSITHGKAPVEYNPTKIGSGVYLGPQTVVQMGVEIGDEAVIGAMSLVNRNISAGKRAWGVPARIQPEKSESKEPA